MAHQIETIHLEQLAHYYQELYRLNRCSKTSCSATKTPTDQKIMHCAACKIAAYCSASCQKADWKTHKVICQHLAADLTPTEGSLDQVFKQMTKREPQPSLFTDSRVFVCTNEIGHEAVVDQMKHLPSQGNTLIAVGATCGLNIAAVRPNITHVVLADVSKKTELFLSNLKVIILGSKDRTDCIKKLRDHIEKYMRSQYSDSFRNSQGLTDHDAVHYSKMIESKEYFLSSDETFAKIKALFQSGNVAIVEANLANPKESHEIATNLQKLCLKVDSLYLSNVVECSYPCEFPSINESVSDLSCESTYIIDTKPRSYKMTKTFSKLMGQHILTRITMASHFSVIQAELPRIQPAEQRIAPRGNLLALYPQIRLFMIDRCCYKELYYRLGIELGFYTESQAENADRLLISFLKTFDHFFSKLCEDEIAKRIESLNYKAFDSEASSFFEFITDQSKALGF